VWWADPAWERPWHAGLLDAGERRRRAALSRAADRSRFVVAAALLRLAAADRLGCPAEALRVSRACPHCERPHGRPCLPGTGISVSVSHSGRRVAVALSPSAEVGIDVEEVVGLDFRALLPSVAASEEASAIGTSADFFRTWTRKEAVLKATGDGLAVPMNELLLTGPGGPPGLLRYPGRPRLAVRLHDLAPPGPYAAALAVLTAAPVQVRERSAASLLLPPEGPQRASAAAS
jgi:4'-phosphopantetheinyl transferase